MWWILLQFQEITNAFRLSLLELEGGGMPMVKYVGWEKPHDD